MCGIVACDTHQPALNYIVPALERLEYRGYDSAGVAVSTDDDGLALLRAVGKLDSLKKLVAGYDGPMPNGTGIGHTRWATHGGVCERNAHPHVSCDERLAIVHNGIIDNAAALRATLSEHGHQFRSDVDSEVVAHLVEEQLAGESDLFSAVRNATRRISGSWAIAALERSCGRIVVGANRCPLVVARSAHGDFAASDVAAVLEWVDSVYVLRDGDIVELGGGRRWAGPEGPRTGPAPIVPGWRPDDLLLGEHQDFMAKEIAEQAGVAARIVDRLSPGIADGALWRNLGMPAPERVRILACGTSLHAGLVIGRVFENTGRVPVRPVIASEGGADIVEPHTTTIAISQSGETADVLQALNSAPLVALTNNVHSSLARRADAVVNCHAGPEVGVAATKTFTAQVLTGVAFALSGLVLGGRLSRTRARDYVRMLDRVPENLAAADRIAVRRIPGLVESLTEAPGFLFIARDAGVPYAAEGALKLQEITYRWAHAYPAGELKHGPIALIDDGTPVVAIDDGNRRIRANLAEVAARGAHVIDIGGPGSAIPVLPERQGPWGPLEAVVALQHLARSLAVALGRDVDKPRNLAKSVTVE